LALVTILLYGAIFVWGSDRFLGTNLVELLRGVFDSTGI